MKYWINSNTMNNYPSLSHIPEETCIREAREETGYEVSIINLLNKDKKKYIFLVEELSN